MLAFYTQSATGTSNLSNTTATFGQNDTNGNSIIVCIGSSSTTAGNVSGVTDSEGNNYTKAFSVANASLGELEVWYTSGIIGGTTNTITVAYTSALEGAAIAYEYGGLIYRTSLDKTSTNSSTGTALSSGTTNQLTQPIELLIGAGLTTVSNTWTAGGGYTHLTTLNGLATIAIAMEDWCVTTPQSAWSASFTVGTSAFWACGIATFYIQPYGTTTSTSSTSTSSTSISSTSSSISSTSSSTSSTSTSISSTSTSFSTSSTSTSYSITTVSTSSTSTSISSTSISSTSSSTSISSTSTSISSTSTSSTSTSSTSTSTSISSTSTSFSSTSSSISSTSSSVSSTSFSSTSSSSSTSTTTLPPPYLDYTYQDEASHTVVQTFTPTSATAWVCPAFVTSVIVEVWGGGGSGASIFSGSIYGDGGGGGGYSQSVQTVVPGTSYPVSVGAGGAGVSGASQSNPGNVGGDSYFSTNTTVFAKGGGGGQGQGVGGGAGGSAASGFGTITNNGGTGGTGGNGTGGTGGGSGGSGGAGGAGNSASTVGGFAGPTNNIYSNGAPGGASTGAGLRGGVPGGGSSGGTSANSLDGGGGMVKLTYIVPTNPQSTNADLINKFNAMNYGNVSVDDGDYFIQTGSQNVIEQFKQTFTANTGPINITWKGRTTFNPQISPVLLQVYNYNTPGWETWASQTVIPADTDFVMQTSITTNLSNYFDSNFNVSVRIYQKAI